MNLPEILKVDEEKCVNCHQCIVACSTKFANDGSGEHVKINNDLCIGCGECLKACTHDARIPVDDFDNFMNIVEGKEKIVAIVAPAIASQFPEKHLHFNGWLKSLGISAIFDVSFGAELTVKSYINHIQKNNPKTVIAQPCPAIVTYIEVYRPELLPYLAPADSPMLHTAKMIKKFYPQYSDHKMIVVSPCLAKKREFDETGVADYNVTMRSFENYFEINQIDLKDYPIIEFDNDKAERAVLFSSPGGLLSTAEREVPGIRELTRKIEGPHTIYEYLDSLPEQIEQGRNPLLIDCLNCENGCNGGTGTTRQKTPPDELEYYISKRKQEMQLHYKTADNKEKNLNNLRLVIDKYWDGPLYERTYINRHEVFTSRIEIPTEEQKEQIYLALHKYKPEDHLNCASCGYHTCEHMAEAIHNNLNKIENCHFYINYELEQKSSEIKDKSEKLESQKNTLIKQSEHILSFIGKIREIAK